MNALLKSRLANRLNYYLIELKGKGKIKTKKMLEMFPLKNIKSYPPIRINCKGIIR